jgi:hypothetical protein
VIAALVVLGLAIGIGSWMLQDSEPWWSSTLGNVAVAVFLLVPGELALRWVRSGFGRVERATEEARMTAESAQSTAERTERSLEDVRKVLLDRQVSDHETELDVYRAMVRNPSQQSLITALKKATDDGLITTAGVRAPVWETHLHYRYVLAGPHEGLEVRLEEDDGSVLSVHPWEETSSPEVFYQSLVQGVRQAGEDLGVKLNDPTESVQQLSEMLIEVMDLRAQELMGYRPYLSRIIERVNGWYFTERYVVPADNLHYGIDVEKLDEMDWEEHLNSKGWYGAGSALRLARELYGYGTD